MTRPINADGITGISTQLTGNTDYDMGYTDGVVRVLKAIENAPTIDAAPVVRCQDCRYWRREVDSHTHWVCTQHSHSERLMHTMPDFYCADGERKMR